MPEADLNDLGVKTADVSLVEDRVVAEAVASAEKAEAEEVENKLQEIDEQINAYRKEEQKLLRATLDSKRRKALEAIRKKIRTANDKRKRFLDAAEARDVLNGGSKEGNGAVNGAAAEQKEGESERDFLIRTGRLTPFQGQFGYERRQSASTPLRRRRGPELSTPNPEELKASFRSKISDRAVELDDGVEGVSPAEEFVSSGSESLSANSPKDSDDDFNPAKSGGAELNSDSDEQGGTSALKRKRARTRASFVELAGDVDDEESGSLGNLEGKLEEIEEREGDDWICDDEEEVEFEGGLRVPSSVYFKLFEYQKTAVSF